MTDETTGFRFLVEQIQMRDKTSAPSRDGGRERSARQEETRRAKPRQGAVEMREAQPRGDRLEETFLSRRWL